MKNSLLALISFFSFFFSNAVEAQVVINEFSAANMGQFTDNYGEDEDWIELYNSGITAVDLSGYYLSDKMNNPTKFQIPNGVSIPPGGHLVVWASGRDEYTGGTLHTNFKITQTKNNEDIVLAGPSGAVIDFNPLDTPNKVNQSWARIGDGNAVWGVAENPSLGTANIGVNQAYADRPNISPAAGFYNGTISISMVTDSPNANIYYTLDGTTPDQSSTLYTGPFNLSFTAVVKSIAISSSNDVPDSFVDYHSFFINETHSLPVMSITGDQIMTLMGGSQIEPTGSFELFENGQRVSDGTGEFNKHGNDSWAYPQRGIDYIARDQFGDDYAVKHDIFDPQITDRDKFQRVILKAAANDNYPFEPGSAHIRDGYVHTLSQLANLEMDERSYEPAILYVNGQYWGVYEMREKVDDHDYTKYYYDQGREWIDFLKTWGNTWVEYGSINDWTTLRNYILSNDMTNPANYAYVESELEVLSLIDYVVLHSHNVSSDWLNWNTAWWRGRKPSGGAQKWRYALWDEDATFGHYINYTGVPTQQPSADPCNPEVLGDPGGQGHIPIFNALLQNDDFIALYISRYADLNNSYFNCEFMIGLLDDMIARIQPEMPRQIARWGGSMGQWESNVQELRDYILARCITISDGIVDCYEDEGISGPYNITIDVFPPNSGGVQANTIVGLNYPWNAEYFGGIDFNLTAIPNCGYTFDHWEVDVHSFGPDQFSAAINMSLLTDDVITAFFIPGLPISVTPVNPLCEGDAPIALTATPPGGAWTGASGGIFNPQENGPGIHTVTYDYTDQAGCVISVPMDITVNEAPSVNVDSDTSAYCSDAGNTFISASANGGSGSFSYTWNTPDGLLSGADQTVSTPGTYIVMASDDASACLASDTLEVIQIPEVLISFTDPGSICASVTALNLEAEPLGGNWSGNSIGANGMISPNDLGIGNHTFTYTFTDQDACVSSEEFTIVITEQPNAIPSNDGPYCNGAAIVLNGNTDGNGNDISYSWTGPGTYTSNLQNPLDATESGTYNLIVDIDGCVSEMVATEVVFNTPPDPMISGADLFCPGSSSVLDAGTGFMEYLWEDGSILQTREVSTSGIYVVTVTDLNGCTGEDEITVNEADAMILSEIIVSPGCQGDCNGSIDLSIQGGNPPFDFEWSTSDLTEDISGLCPGNYTVTVTDSEGCSISSNYSLNAPGGLILDALITNNTCFENCDGSIDLSVSGGVLPYTYLWDCGDTNAEDQENLCAGTCNVTVTDANGCAATASFEVIEPEEMIATLSPQSVSCEGECDGIVGLTVTGGTGPYSFFWSNNTTACDLSQACSGAYSVIVTDANACTVMGQVVVPEPDAISINAMVSPPVCGTNCTGTIDITVDGGTAPLSFLWNDGSSDSDRTGLCNGNYELTVTDINGCSQTETFTIIENEIPEPIISGEDSFCSGSSTVCDVGTGYAFYLWSEGTITPSIDINTPGLYSVTVTAFNGCTGEASVLISENQSLQPDISGLSEFCEGEISILDAGSGYSIYEWSTDDFSQTIEVSQNGNYSLTVTDANGCSGTDNITVTVFQNPNPVIAGSSTFCTGSSTTLDAGSYASYLWSNGETTSTILVDTPGTFSVDLIDQNGCSGSAAITVTESSEINPVIAGDLEFCVGGSTILNAGSGFDAYLWSDGSMSQTLEVFSAGDYSVTVEDATSCSGTTMVSVSIVDPPMVNLQTTATLCNTTDGGSVINLFDLILAGDSNGFWEDADNSGAVSVADNLDFDGIAAGDYTFVYTTNSAVGPCAEITESVVISVTDCACPSVQFSMPAPLCNGDGQLDLSTIINTNESGSWSIFQDPGGINPAVINNGIFDATASDAGTYSLQFLLDNVPPPGCPQDFVLPITVDPMPQAGEVNIVALYCQNDLLVIDLAGQVIGSSPGGVWTENSAIPSQGNAFDPVNATFSTNLQMPGNYTFVYTVPAIGICPEESVELAILIQAQPSIDIVSNIVDLDCDNTSAVLDATGSSSGMGFDITWTGPGIVLDGNENTLTPTVNAPGQYTLSITNNQTGCTLSEGLQVNENMATPQVNAGVDQTLTCSTTELNLQASGDLNPPFEIQWAGPGINASNMNELDPNVAVSGIYSLTILDPNNGCSAMDEVEIFENITAPDVVTQSALEIVDCNNPTADLIGDSPNLNVSFEWFDAQNISIGNTAVLDDISSPGIYTVLVTDSQNGCVSSELIEVLDNTNYPIADAGVSDILNCVMTEVTLDGSASATGADINYLWTGPGLSGLNDQVTSLANLPGLYTLTVINTSNGCISTDQIDLAQDIEMPIVNTNQPAELDCTIEEVALSGNGSSNGNNFVYSWLDANGNVLSTDLETVTQTAGIYTLSILNTENGCTAAQSVPVTEDSNVPNALIWETADPACFGDTDGSIVINEVLGGLEPYVYAIDGADFNTNPAFFNLLPGNYDLVVQDANGCEFEENITINAPSDLQLNLGPDQEFRLGEVVELEAFVNIPDDLIDTIIWTPAELINCVDPTNNCLEVEVSTFNTLEIAAMVIDTNGCTNNDEITVRIKKSRAVFFPSAFSPNDDGNNDKFIIFANDVLVANIRNFRVFNRWGEVMHEALNIQANDSSAGWDGRFKGKPLNPGVFIYTAEVEFVDGRVEIFQGDVTLVK